MADENESWRKHMPLVEAQIAALVANPPTRRDAGGERWPETSRANAIGAKAVQELRELACRRTGMTMDQLLEAEANVSHPREIVPVTPSPAILARSRMKKAGVPELYVRHVADAAPLECTPLTAVREFLSSRLGFLMLSGGKGTRKSGSASWALGQLDGGAFVDANAIVRLSIEDRPKWDRIITSPLIVVDDIGTEKVDGSWGAFVAAFSELFNGAYSNCRRVIMTGNVTAEQFKRDPERGGFGARVEDRFREMGRWKVIGGESVRVAPPHWSEREPGSDDE